MKRALSLGLVLLVGVGCGKEERVDDDRAPRYERVALMAEGQATVGVQTVAELGPETEGHVWSAVDAERTEVREVDGRPAMVVERLGAPKWVQIPIPAEHRNFQKVIIELAAASRGVFETVEVAPYRDGQPLQAAQVTELTAGASFVPTPMTFEALRSGEVVADELRVKFLGRSALGVVGKVTLLRAARHTDLALDANAASDWPTVELAGIRRRYSHVPTDLPAVARITVQEGDTLSMYVGIDPSRARDGERLDFHCAWTAGERTFAKEASVKAGEWEKILFESDQLPVGDAVFTVTTTSDVDEGIGVGVIAELALQRSRPGAPTVLLITSDTHRADHLSIVNRRSIVRTPNLDALALDGVLFEDCFAQTNVTNPSHISLMTGVHPKDTGILNNRVRLSRRADTIAERFAEAGFKTLAVTSAFHLLDNHSGLGQGFDRMEGPLLDQRDGEIGIDELIDWLDESEGVPVFAWLHLFDAHEPYGPPEPYDRRYYEGDPFSGEGPGIDPKLLPQHLPGLKDPQFPYAQYRAEVDYLDGALRDLFAHERIKTAAIAFTADHGESFGQHGIWWNHGGLYPDTIHIPLIMRWPGGPKGVRVEAPVRQSDVASTLMAIAGVDPGQIDGADLREVVSGHGRIDVRYGLSAHFLTGSIQLGKWLLILELRPHFEKSIESMRHCGVTELYDLEKDPECLNDLLIEEFETAKQLRQMLIEWLGTRGGPSLSEAQERSAEDEAMLEGLGYAGGGSADDASQWWDPQARAQGGWKNSPWNHLFSDPDFPLDEFRARAEAWAARFRR